MSLHSEQSRSIRGCKFAGTLVRVGNRTRIARLREPSESIGDESDGVLRMSGDSDFSAQIERCDRLQAGADQANSARTVQRSCPRLD
ncbi:hypothetical protein C7S18_13610 [Ahniella affigens]|uniref:Uncharacterized protein n=2 Tax=Ahniella affigens TaxID=2021234 RepID=A0A2P1PTJ1_9GAMM|nr:hypothetical protein C7S18_13610 [Ahniella affigens]